MSKISVTIDGRTFEVEVSVPPGCDGAEISASVDGVALQVTLSCMGSPDQIEWALVDGRPYELTLDRDLSWIRSRSGRHRLEVRDSEVALARPADGDGRVKAPIPGLITRVLIEQGAQVSAGQPLMVLEAMKMENEIRAPRDGVITQLSVSPGKGVTLHELLAEIS